MSETVKAEKVDEKKVICLVSMFPSRVMVLKLLRKVHFWQFCADLSKKSKSIKTIYKYASGMSRYPLSESGKYWLLCCDVLFRRYIRV